jgi:hypothetical protein
MTIVGNYCIDVGRHGYLIPLSKKREFEANIKKKKEAFMVTLKSEEGSGSALEQILGASRGKLNLYLVQEIMADLNCLDRLCADNRMAIKRLKDKDRPDHEKSQILQEVVDDFIDNKLRFPKTTDLISSVDVVFDYYDVSDELLSDDEFKNVIKAAGIDPRTYSNGFEKDNGQHEF